MLKSLLMDTKLEKVLSKNILFSYGSYYTSLVIVLMWLSEAATEICIKNRYARIGMFCILKPLFKSKSNIRICSVHFALILILDIIFFYFKSAFSIFSCTAMKKSTFYLRLLKNLPKIVKVIIFLLL